MALAGTTTHASATRAAAPKPTHIGTEDRDDYYNPSSVLMPPSQYAARRPGSRAVCDRPVNLSPVRQHGDPCDLQARIHLFPRYFLPCAASDPRDIFSVFMVPRG